MDNPYVFIIEDTALATSPAFLISLSTDLTLTLSPQQNIDITMCVDEIRGCRASPCQSSLPAPSMLDAIPPFGVNINAHLTERLQDVNATITTSERISVRVGIKDIKLIQNTLRNLVPKPWRQRIVQQKQQNRQNCKGSSTINSNTTSPSSSVAGSPSTHIPIISEMTDWKGIPSDQFPFALHFYGNIPEISLMVVDDIDDAELPVAHAIVKSVSMMVVMDKPILEAEASLQLEGEYYDKRKSVWEPVVEPWSVNAKMEVEPRKLVVGDRSDWSFICTDILITL